MTVVLPVVRRRASRLVTMLGLNVVEPATVTVELWQKLSE